MMTRDRDLHDTSWVDTLLKAEIHRINVTLDTHFLGNLLVRAAIPSWMSLNFWSIKLRSWPGPSCAAKQGGPSPIDCLTSHPSFLFSIRTYHIRWNFYRDFISRNHEKAGSMKLSWFVNFCDYVSCLILRPVTDTFSRMQTNSWNMWKLIHCETFNVYGMYVCSTYPLIGICRSNFVFAMKHRMMGRHTLWQWKHKYSLKVPSSWWELVNQALLVSTLFQLILTLYTYIRYHYHA